MRKDWLRSGKSPYFTLFFSFQLNFLSLVPLKSADVSGAGTRDEPLRTSAWKATAARVSRTGRSGI